MLSSVAGAIAAASLVVLESDAVADAGRGKLERFGMCRATLRQ